MPYPRQEPLYVLIEEPTPYYMTDVEVLQVALTKARQERDVWKSKYQVVNFENEELRKEAKVKNDLLQFQEDWLAVKDKEIHRQSTLLQQHEDKRKKRSEDLFSSDSQPSSKIQKMSEKDPSSGGWKLIVEQLIQEKEEQRVYYERKIQELKGTSRSL